MVCLHLFSEAMDDKKSAWRIETRKSREALSRRTGKTDGEVRSGRGGYKLLHHGIHSDKDAEASEGRTLER